MITSTAYLVIFHKAREAAFTEAEAESLVAQRPYDLRNAAVSNWLNATGDPAQVAEWAGHTVDVLLQVYAKCIAGRQDAAKRRIFDATRPLKAPHPAEPEPQGHQAPKARIGHSMRDCEPPPSAMRPCAPGSRGRGIQGQRGRERPCRPYSPAARRDLRSGQQRLATPDADPDHPLYGRVIVFTGAMWFEQISSILSIWGVSLVTG